MFPKNMLAFIIFTCFMIIIIIKICKTIKNKILDLKIIFKNIKKTSLKYF